MTTLNDPEIHWRANAKTDSTSIIRIGFWSVGVTVLVFFIWALFFPLASAVITPGTFVSEGKNKQIQHQKGGRVREIFVREGAHLKTGQPVLSLDTTRPQAELTQLEARHASLLALKSRLDAERSGGLRKMLPAPVRLDAVTLRGAAPIASGARPAVALRGGGGNPIVLGGIPAIFADDVRAENISIKIKETRPFVRNEFMESQREAYTSGREALAREIEALDKKAATLQKQREGLFARIAAQKSLLAMSKRELNRLRPLVQNGYVARNRLNDRERVVLELGGMIASLALDAEGVNNQIEEVRVQIKKARVDNSNTAAQEYTKIIAELAEISDQLIAARESVTGSIIRAPASGILSRLLTTTVGGVVGGGDLIGEIVPEDAPLVVQARVLPGDINYVHVGQGAEIAVTAFNRRIDDTFMGQVTYKSADAEQDEKTGNPYFTVRLKLTGSKGEKRDRQNDIQAGMQSEVYIHTGARTFMTYLAKPMIDSFRRAFREQ